MPASVFHSFFYLVILFFFFFFFHALTLHEQLSLCKQSDEIILTINYISELELYFDFSTIRVTSLGFQIFC